jgi:type IV secretory pathway VirB10-like protein
VTKVTDITDGLPGTIALIQVPSAFKNPWLAGGGSTVRGCPETGCVKPFVSEQPDGKKGTTAIMANGDVRFIHDNIPDDVFKAMCTIKGGEKVDINKYTTLIPPPPEKDESETASEPSPAPPKEEKKEQPKKKEPAKTEEKKESKKN